MPEFRDLNGNGVLDVYEDPTASTSDRVEDLLAQMTVAEKVGLMFHAPLPVPRSGKPAKRRGLMTSAGAAELVGERHLNHFNLLMAPDATTTAKWANAMQRVAERTRLGIPITFSSDPRHAAEFNPGAGMKQKGFSAWPSQLGLGAGGDVAAVEEFGRIAAAEFRAVGLTSILNPMADVATEPRWGRIGGTFGDDTNRVAEMTAAYIRGFQGEALGASSVATMVKHFPGCGPQEDGSEPHFEHGKNQVYPGGAFDDHLEPFRRAFEAGARQVMLSYGIPVGQTSEDVAIAFNKEIVTDLLRGELGFDGVVCTDWVVTEPEKLLGVLEMKPASAWGVEHLTPAERYRKAVEAGVDQFGGHSNPEILLGLVADGTIPEARIDESARRILAVKFDLGLFDDPYVDEEAVAAVCGSDTFTATGRRALERSTVVLSNDGTLPVAGRPKLYVDGIDRDVAARYGDVVRKPAGADLAIVSRKSPSERGFSKEILELFFPHGSLELSRRDRRKLLGLCATVPTVVAIRMDRPPVIPEVVDAAAAVLATFTIPDEVLLDTIFGKVEPSGRLPVEVPSSMAAVEASPSDVAGTDDPLFERGHGLTYDHECAT